MNDEDEETSDLMPSVKGMIESILAESESGDEIAETRRFVQMGRGFAGMFLSMVEQGVRRSEALEIVCSWVHASVSHSHDQDDDDD